VSLLKDDRTVPMHSCWSLQSEPSPAGSPAAGSAALRWPRSPGALLRADGPLPASCRRGPCIYHTVV
jgi:hypothetical protein